MKSILFITAIVLFLSSCQSGPEESAWSPAPGILMTRWSKDVSPGSVLPEYPRPQMEREEWLNLNGLWDYAIRPVAENEPVNFDGKILVPFCPESALSGVGKSVGPENRLWYRRSFEIPETWEGNRIMLNFGAVDWEAKVWINGKEMGSHTGGYDAFTIDITGAIKKKKKQEIIISVWDPVDQSSQPRGKQVLKPEGIWYTSVTGIWQTVWLEPVSREHIRALRIITDIDLDEVTIVADVSAEAMSGFTLETSVSKDGIVLAEETSGQDPVVISLTDPVLWTPDYPYLYDIQLALVSKDGVTTDSIRSYFGMRKISLGKDAKGFTRIMLNDEFVFQFGPLDQGWWPDGLYTAPTDEALKYDIEATKALGFNMARKHVKAEPDRWYYWCDKLGLLVWQDMPSGDAFIGQDDPDITRTQESEKNYRFELKELIMDRINHPSIIVWVPFNEGWGQFKTEEIVEFIRETDTTRLINPTSGWTDRNAGDIRDIHAYPGPAMPEPESARAIVLGEFGGLGLPIEGHTWQEKDNWGYRKYDTQDQLLEAYTGLIKVLMPMVPKGLSAAVYTQTTDVEIEVNGLMTYDRAVIKMDPAVLSRINKGLLPE